MLEGSDTACWGIRARFEDEDAGYVGCAGLAWNANRFYPNDPNYFVYLTKKAAQGRGVGSVVTATVAKIAFEEERAIQRIATVVYPGNTVSRNMIAHWGYAWKERIQDGRGDAVDLYDLTRESFACRTLLVNELNVRYAE
jgi:RimJ/RimL family protein N-acetyltransferase